jgi:formate hydrogenlyase transcriptional activator
VEPARTSDQRGEPRVADLERALLEVARSTTTHTLGTLLCDLAALLQKFIACDRLTLVLHDSEHDTMRLHSVAAFQRSLMTVTELPVLDSPSGVAWQTQEPVLVPSVERETRFARATPFLLAEGMRSLCAVPLTSPLRRLGALSFASRKDSRKDTGRGRRGENRVFCWQALSQKVDCFAGPSVRSFP